MRRIEDFLCMQTPCVSFYVHAKIKAGMDSMQAQLRVQSMQPGIAVDHRPTAHAPGKGDRPLAARPRSGMLIAHWTTPGV
jgi:hypothetical protein